MYGAWVHCPLWLERRKTFPLWCSSRPWAFCCFLYFCYTGCKIKHFWLFQMLYLTGTKGKCSGFHLTGKCKWSNEEWNNGTYCHGKDEQFQCPSSSLTTQTPSFLNSTAEPLTRVQWPTAPVHLPCSSSLWKCASISCPSTTCPSSNPIWLSSLSLLCYFFQSTFTSHFSS